MKITFKEVFKSKGFKKLKDKPTYKEHIEKELFEIGEHHKDVSNNIAPFDTGNLRRDSKTFIEYDGQSPVLINEWFVSYAVLRYKKNYKNPQTTEWAKKGFIKNKKLYLNKLKKIPK